MPLSRLENFLKNVQGNVIYVNPEELDATDDISNTGNSRTRPFKTIQRALIESARFSYQLGKDNDKFDKTTILVSPGVHYIDNRPGYSIDTDGDIEDVNGTAASIGQLTTESNFNIQDPNNVLYIFNSTEGGVILPRGTSIVGQDLRKTKIRPKFVPDPSNNNISRSAIFRVTGSCWFFGFSFFDADPNDRIYRDYTTSVFTPNYSHHKLTCFEYADGVNITISGKGNTDLDMYYHKLTLAYGASSGRALPNYPTNDDFEAVVDEYRIVGAISQTGATEIEDIYSGANPTDTTATSIVTVVTKTNHGFSVGTPVLIAGVDNAEYDGSYVVSQVQSDTTFTYSLANTPTSTATPSLAGKNPTVEVESDSVSSSSPYIFNCSIRSVFGLCGMHADGEKATGFKSMVVAQFTGIALNKDDNAYVKYNSTTGIYQDQAALGSGVSLHTDSLARHKPEWQNFHVKVSKNGIIQTVSVFAIGYAQHFVAESGGDMSITNSNSNFGAKSLEADFFRREAFLKDDQGYLTEIVPAQQNRRSANAVNYLPLDVEIISGAGQTDCRLHFYQFNKIDAPPSKFASNYIVGAKTDDLLFCNVNNAVYSAPIVMPVPGDEPDDRIATKKEYLVGRVSGINSITGSTLTLQENHRLLPGESIRIFSKDGDLPDGLKHRTVYYAITESLNADQIRVASTFNNAINNTHLSNINNLGGELRVVSLVSDKNPGDPGHPIQFDTSGWYINVGAGNSLASGISTQKSVVTPKTGNTFISRTDDIRTDEQKSYQLRYSIPQISALASPPQNGFSIEESSAVIDDDNFQNDNTALTSVQDLRTKTNIINASWSSNVGVVTTLYPHRLKAGHLIEIQRLKSGNNTTGAQNSGFNGLFVVSSVPNNVTFNVGLNTDPGGISTIASSSDNVPYTNYDRTIVGSGRTDSPYFIKRDFGPSYQIYDQNVIQGYEKDVQDGIYDITILGYLDNVAVTPFSTASNKFPQNYADLIPVSGQDNVVDDPQAASSYAMRDIIGQVETSDPADSVTRESLHSFLEQTGIGIGITGSSISGDTVTIETAVEHNLRGIKEVSINNSGVDLGDNSGSSENYFNIRAEGGSGTGCLVNVTINTAGNVSTVTIKEPGSGYTVGETLTLRGIPTHGTPTDATIDVDSIYNEVGDVIQVIGVSSETYNGLYRITSIPNNKQISYTAVAGAAATDGIFYHVGVATDVQTIEHDPSSGIATVTMLSDLGLRRGDQIVIDGCTGSSTVYNGTHFIIDRIGYGSSLTVNLGITSNAPALTGVATAHGTGFSVRANGRGIPIYGGKTLELTAGISTTTTTINLTENGLDASVQRGDYFLIEDEIVRSTNGGTGFIRACLGSNATAHDQNIAVKKIKPLPVENRRYSILRASGHTFEYVGFGPGNYSTAMPQTQDRVLTVNEKVISQSLQTRGGLVVYTGMNDIGEFFIGRTKFDPTTGKQEAFGFDTATEGAIINESEDSLTVDTLTVNDNLLSLGNTEVVHLSLKGNKLQTDINKNVTVGIRDGDTCPPTNQNNDNILLRTEWDRGGYMGWVRTNEPRAEDKWKRFGIVSHECNTEHYSMDKLGVGVTYADDNLTVEVQGNIGVSSGINIGAGQTITVNSNPLLPVGMVMPYAGTSAPPLYKFCDGSELSKTAFAALFEAIGTTYGESEDGLKFKLPDLRGRVIAAPDNMGGTAAGRMDGATANSSQSTNFNAPGDTGGSQEHVQSLNELATHGHSINNTNHTHKHALRGVQDGDGAGNGGASSNTTGNDFTTTNPNAGWNPTAANQGSSYPMNNVQPTMAMNYIIFANA
jgi:microcystin-dependent protein